jgi:molecular chaperone GrpE
MESAESTPAQEVAATESKTAELAIVKQSLDEARAQAAQNWDQLLRLKAEFENFRRRAEKEKTDARRWGKEDVVVRLVSLMDVMEQAEAAAHNSPDMKSVVAGLDMLYGEFKRLLTDEGLEDVPGAPGDAFDPDRHEAVETVEHDGEPGKILVVLQKGYRFQGALLRPARVKVSASPAVQ